MLPKKVLKATSVTQGSGVGVGEENGTEGRYEERKEKGGGGVRRG